jgi:hypothetical protein
MKIWKIHIMLDKTLEATKEQVRQEYRNLTNQQFKSLLEHNAKLTKLNTILKSRLGIR